GVLERAALARGVHALEDEEHRPLAVVLAGEQSLLEVEQLLADRPQVSLAGLLVPVVPRRRVRLDRGQVDRAGLQTEQVGEGLGRPLGARHAPIMSEIARVTARWLPRSCAGVGGDRGARPA